MPVLIPAAPAPSNNSDSPSRHVSSGPSHYTSSAVNVGDEQVSASSNKFPVVSLDVDAMSDDIAARLATSLLGHVLFLKGQVPMPVAQLARLPNAKTSPRILKQRNELLSSYDTLMSHFNTTFTSLSSTMAKIAASNKPNSLSAPVQGNFSKIPDRCRAYVAIVIGSSITSTSASSRVIFAVDGLEVKAMGVRDDVPPLRKSQDEEENESAECESGDGSEDQDEDESADEDEDEDDEDEDSENEVEDVSDADDDDDASNLPPDSPPPSPRPRPTPYSPSPTYAEQQNALQAAERLLSKTLLLADAEGNGLSADMAPTQIHILLRAPRRFSHPAWIPRQNISASLESSLDEFLAESGVNTSKACGSDRQKKRTTNKKSGSVWGVWVAQRGGLDLTAVDPGAEKDGVEGREEVHDEWNEMIWWNWDGKLTGFSDW